MSKVQGLSILKEYQEKVQKALPLEIFVTVENDGDDAYRNTYDDKAGAIRYKNREGALVATYKLVKVEELALREQIVSVTIRAED